MQVGVYTSVTLKWGVDSEDNGNVPKSPLMGMRGLDKRLHSTLLIKSLWSFVSTGIRVPVCDHLGKNGQHLASKCHYLLLSTHRFRNKTQRSWFFTMWYSWVISFQKAKDWTWNTGAWSKAPQGFRLLEQSWRNHHAGHFTSSAELKTPKQLKEKLQSQWICLFTHIVSDMGQTSPTCRHQAFSCTRTHKDIK